MSMRKIYRKIAKEHGVSPKEVREEIQAAITQAYENPPDDNITVAYQNRVPRKGKIPNAGRIYSICCKPTETRK